MADKTKVVLVRPPYSLEIYQNTYTDRLKVGDKQVEPPMALMQLAAAVLKQGHDVRIIDGEVENLLLDELLEQVQTEHPDVVGVTSTTPEFSNAQLILQRIKKCMPRVVTVMGGAHATHVPWDIADQIPELDYVVVYEGEKALQAIATGDTALVNEYSRNAQELLKGAGVENAHRYAGKILLGPSQSTDDLEQNTPIRDRPYIDMSPYRYADPELGLVYTESVETARGCPFACSFCSSARSGLGIRSVDNVLEELKTLDGRFRKMKQRGFVIFIDDTLTFSRSRATELFEGVVRCGLNFRFKMFTRANTIATTNGIKDDIDFVKLMKRAGAATISFGIESGSEVLNKQMRKGVTLDDYRRAYDVLNKAGVEERRGSFIVGHPHETEGTIKESIAFAKELRLHRIGVNIMTPYPGASVATAAQQGDGIYLEANSKDWSQYVRWGRSVVSTDELSAEALEYWHKRFLAEMYTSGVAVVHVIREFLKGNGSWFYHRPVIYACRDRARATVKGTWHHTPDFPKPDHTGYSDQNWGRPHVSKPDCIAVLGKRYGIKPSRKRDLKVEPLQRKQTHNVRHQAVMSAEITDGVVEPVQAL